MTPEQFKAVAEQLRMPHGTSGKETGEKMNQGNKLMNLATIEQLKPTANDSILEIGMGNGFFVSQILANDKTIRYTGCDFSSLMVEESIRLNRDFVEKGQARFNLANARALPYLKGSFNKVFTVNTIYFWGQMKNVLSEIKRVLEPEGQLIISLRPKAIMDKLPVTNFGFQTFSKIDCVEVLHKNGFSVGEVIEKEDTEIELFGQKFKNAFMIVKAIKNKINPNNAAK